MVLWIVLAVLTAAVAAILIAPLKKASQSAAVLHDDEAAVYRDQLQEVDRDQAQGLIGPQEADYARAEIGRRLLSATAGSGKRSRAMSAGGHRLATSFVICSLPAVGICLYVMLGTPGLPAQPLEARLANPGNNVALLVAKAERHLAQNPNDGAGWDLLAPIYFRTQRLGDAEAAYRNALRLQGPSSARLAGLGETLVAARDGVVSDEAKDIFEQAVKLDAGNMRARFYAALGLEQAGRAGEALAAFKAIAADSPPGAAWATLVSEHIAKNGGAPENPAAPPAAPGNPTADDVAAAQAMSPQDRQQMVAGMVESLASKLKDEPNNIEGWLRLVRSYKVLGDDEKASRALADSLAVFPADSDNGRRLVALAGEIGISTRGVRQ